MSAFSRKIRFPTDLKIVSRFLEMLSFEFSERN